MRENNINFSQYQDITLSIIDKEFITLFKEIKFKGCIQPLLLSVSLSKKLRYIDDILYSYLLLFITEFPDINIVIEHESINPKVNQEGYATLENMNQYLHGINEFYNDKIRVKIGNNNSYEKPDGKIVSSKFLIPILINNDSIGELYSPMNFFEELLKHKFDKEKLRDNFTNNNEFIKIVRQQIPSNKENYFTHLYIGILDDLNILRYKLTKTIKPKTSYHYKNLDTLNSKHFFKIYSEIIESVNEFNSIQLSILRVLITKFQPVEKPEFYPYATKLKNLIRLVKDLSNGLFELSKNIVEHSSENINEGIGVISIRIFNRKKYNNLKYETYCFKKYQIDNSEEDFNYYLDINVIDSGKLDIKSKYRDGLLKSSQNVQQSKINVNYSDDIEKINKLHFSSFFNYHKIILNHQVKRANARLGLLLFSSKVLSKKGLIQVQSSNQTNNLTEGASIYLNNKNEIEAFDDINSTISLGTLFTFIIPITSLIIESKYIDSREKSSTDIASPTSNFLKLLQYKFEDEKSIESENNYLILNKYVLQKENEVNRYDYVAILSEAIRHKVSLHSTKKTIALINAKDYPQIESSSDWIRLVACLNLINDETIDIIIYNIKPETLNEIINLNKLFSETELGFWSNKLSILFFFEVSGIWFNCVLGGKRFTDFCQVNKNISNYHFNYYRIYELIEFDSKKFIDANLIYGQLFNEGKLLNFELLIKNESKFSSLFEDSIASLLNIDIKHTLETDTKVDKQSYYFSKMQGFKSSNSHFKIGSKIHISDFYFAKRLFYNSFFANRFAFLIARYIKENPQFLSLDKNAKISLIGYSYYSDLLVGKVRNLLNQIGYFNVNHDVVLETGITLRNTTTIYPNVVLIIPISSTFTTSKKIKKIIQKIIYKDQVSNSDLEINNILGEDINIIVVGNKGFTKIFDLNLNEIEDKASNHYIYKSFDWRTIFERKIQMGETNCTQKYFIPIETNWEHIYECSACFKEEKSLIETEKNEVTLDIVFEMPKSSMFNSANSYFDKCKMVLDTNPFIFSRPITWLNTRYEYFINSSLFFEANKEIIEIWLRKIQKKLSDKISEREIVIFTPSYAIDSGFVGFINEILFIDTATVIQYSPRNEDASNFIKFHKDILTNSYILFVDDVITTGSSCNEVIDILKLLDRNIDHALFMINRMGYEYEKTIRQNINLEYFIKFNVFNLVSEQDTTFILNKEKKYNQLAESSLLDNTKIHFKRKEQFLRPFNLNNNKYLEKNNIYSLFKFLIIHKLLEVFEIDESENFINTSYPYWVNEQSSFDLNEINNELRRADSLKDLFFKYPEFEDESIFYLVECLSNPPFIKHKDIKDRVFLWVLNTLKSSVKEISNINILQEILNSTEQIDKLLFKYKKLLEIAANLKINYLYGKEMILAIKSILDQIDKHASFASFLTSYQERITNFYLGIILEVIYEDEAKAIVLIENIVDIIRKDTIVSEDGLLLNLRNNFDNSFIHLLRLLVLESNYIFETFFEYFYEENSCTIINENRLDKIRISDLGNNEIKIRKQILKYRKLYRSTALNKLLKRSNVIGEVLQTYDRLGIIDTSIEEAFVHTITLKTILNNECRRLDLDSEYDLSNRLESLLKYLCKILDINDGGAYLAVRFREKSKDNSNRIDADEIYCIGQYFTDPETHKLTIELCTPNSILLKVFNNNNYENRFLKSSFEVMVDKNDKFIFRDAAQSEITQEFLESSNDYTGEKQYRNLYFLRITDISEAEGANNFITTPSAVICFYNNKIEIDETSTKRVHSNLQGDPSLFDPKRVRFLLMCRHLIRDYIQLHFKNDSFGSMLRVLDRDRYEDNLHHAIDDYEKLLCNEVRTWVDIEKQNNILYYANLVFNKIKLISQSKNKETLKVYIVNEFISEINKIARVVFTASRILCKGIDNSIYDNSVKIINNLEEKKTKDALFLYGVSLTVYKGLIQDIVFEVLNNIREHVIDDYCRDMNPSKPLIIRLDYMLKDNVYYFTIGNNHNHMNMLRLVSKNKLMATKGHLHGLNLISKYMSIHTTERVIYPFLEINEDFFNICIPIIPAK